MSEGRGIGGLWGRGLNQGRGMAGRACAWLPNMEADTCAGRSKADGWDAVGAGVEVGAGLAGRCGLKEDAKQVHVYDFCPNLAMF